MTELLQHPAFDVFIYASITAIATGLGALPFFIIKDITRNWLGIANATASGLMLAASFGLIYEGINHDVWYTFYGILIGLVFIILSQIVIDKYDDTFSIKHINKVDSSKILLIVGIMTIHSFTEGVSVGVSFSGGLDLGLFIRLSICGNIPTIPAHGAWLCRRGHDLDGICRAHPRRP